MDPERTVSDDDGVIPEFTRLYEEHASGGAAHIVADDANVRDSDLDFCEQWAKEQHCEVCDGPCTPSLDLIRALRPMTALQRLRACGFGDSYAQDIDPVTGEWLDDEEG